MAKTPLLQPTIFLITIIITTLISTTTSQNPFHCTTRTTCNSIIDYITPNTTTLSSIATLFTIRNLRTLLAANNFPLTTPSNFSLQANQTLRIPFPCTCLHTNNTGISNRRPIYTVVPDDGLYHIAAEVFSGLVTYQEIQAVNNIRDADRIDVGQRLWIPLPCSCDEVDGIRVVHYGHRVVAGSSVEGIAQRFNTTSDTLLRLNDLASPRDLLAGAILDVPLRACSSVINNNSMDYPLLVPNNTYVFTARNCVMCRCDAAVSWMLQCQPAGINSSCPVIRCGGAADNLYLGNTTSSGCNTTTCAYAGYNNSTIQTVLALESTCPVPIGRSSAARLQGGRWRLNGVFMSIHFVLLCFWFVN